MVKIPRNGVFPTIKPSHPKTNGICHLFRSCQGRIAGLFADDCYCMKWV